MSDYQRAEPQTLVQSRMSFDEKETLMIYLLRNPGVFLEARQVLTPEHFSEPYEIIWAVAWRSVLDLYEQFSALPPREVIETDSLARIENHPGAIPQNGVDELRSFFQYVFDVDMVPLDSYFEYGFTLLQNFLKERHWIDPLRSFMAGLGNSNPVDLPVIMSDYQSRLISIQGMRNTTMEDLIPDDWEPDILTKLSTGLEFLDQPMGGGWANEEVYGLLGTFGSGKTMLACNIASEAAMTFLQEAQARSALPRHVHYFTYETPPNDIRKRTISYLARIKLDHLDLGRWSSTLSRSGTRHPYEANLFPNNPDGEWERLQAIMPVKNIMHIHNMTGPRNNPRAGSGWIDEIHAELDKSVRRYNITPGLVIIDYALVCCRRYIRAKGWDVDRKLRHLAGEFGDECRRLIAQQFNCGVWVLNQLSGVANRRASGARLSHADSAEATNFAENLWYAFCLGNKDREHGCSVIDATKTRRSAGSAQPAIVQLQGDMARFVRVDDRYMIDRATSKIVTKRNGYAVDPDAMTNRIPAPNRRGPGEALSPT